MNKTEISALLGEIVAAGFLAAGLVTSSPRTAGDLPDELFGNVRAGEGSLWRRADLFEDHAIAVELTPAPPGTAGTVLRVRPLEPLRFARPVLYWSPGRPEETESLPSDARFLGPVVEGQERRLPMPADSIGRMSERSAGTFGTLHLHGLGVGVVDRAAMPIGGWSSGGSH